MALELPPPPPPPSKASERSPLGVPDDYMASSPRRPAPFASRLGPKTYQPPPRPPRYFAGDELIPAALAPERVAAMQRALATAGLIGPKTKFRVGVWDDTTRNAYRNLLEFANVYGIDEAEALRRYASSEETDPSGDAERAPLVVRQSSPDDLRATFETVARRRIGRKLAPEEVERFVSAYQAEEAAVQTQAYGAAETGGTVTDVADPQAFLAAKLAKEYGVEVGATAIAEQGNEFFDLLKEVGG